MNPIKNKFILSISLLFITLGVTAQSYNAEKTALTNFLTRMYKSAPFEGVRVVNDYETYYLMSVLSLDASKYDSESTMFRVASVKAMSQASRFFNGSSITSDLVIRTSEKPDGKTETEVIETINEHSVGYVKALEMLTNFDNDKDRRVFIYLKEIDDYKK